MDIATIGTELQKIVRNQDNEIRKQAKEIRKQAEELRKQAGEMQMLKDRIQSLESVGVQSSDTVSGLNRVITGNTSGEAGPSRFSGSHTGENVN